MTRKRAQPSLLSRGAPALGDDPAPRVPWWQSPRRLLAHVIAHAKADEAFAADVARAVGELSAHREDLRDALKEGLAKRGRGRAKNTQAELHMFLDTYEVLRQPPYSMKSTAAEAQLALMFNKSQERIHNLLSKGRKLRAVEKRRDSQP